MAISLQLTGWDEAGWRKKLQKELPDHEILLSTEPHDSSSAIDFCVAWSPKPGVLASFPDLKVVFSGGAGVDHILRQPDLPDVPVVRAIVDDMTERMTNFVLFNVFFHHRKMLDIQAAQQRGEWISVEQPSACNIRVGILGLGVLGADAARHLVQHGYDVAGWSRTEKQIDGIKAYCGDEGLDTFLRRSDILVCLLPSTPATKGLLNSDLFAKLPHDGALDGPVLINAGRGALQKEDDILRALDDGTLNAVSLDVFETEPLPETSPLWRHPRTVITPHNAADSDPSVLARYIAGQIKAFEAGKGLENIVSKELGY